MLRDSAVDVRLTPWPGASLHGKTGFNARSE